MLINDVPFENVSISVKGTRIEAAFPVCDESRGRDFCGEFTLHEVAAGDFERFLDVLRAGFPLSRYWRRRANRRNGMDRRLPEPELGRAWRRFRRSFLGGPL